MGLIDVAYNVSRDKVEGNRRLAGSLEAWAEKLKQAKKDKAKKSILELVSSRKIPVKELIKRVNDAGLDIEKILPTLDQVSARRLHAGISEATPEVLQEIYSAKGNVDMGKIIKIGAKHGLGPMDTITMLGMFNKTGLMPTKEKIRDVGPQHALVQGGKKIFYNPGKPQVMNIGNRPYNVGTGQYGAAPPKAPLSEAEQAKQDFGLIKQGAGAGITSTTSNTPLGQAIQRSTGRTVESTVIPIDSGQQVGGQIEKAGPLTGGGAGGGGTPGAPIAYVEPGKVKVPQAPQKTSGQITPKILLDKIQQTFVALQNARRGTNQYISSTKTKTAIQELEKQLAALAQAYVAMTNDTETVKAVLGGGSGKEKEFWALGKQQ